jgi:hypothetical protein
MKEKATPSIIRRFSAGGVSTFYQRFILPGGGSCWKPIPQFSESSFSDEITFRAVIRARHGTGARAVQALDRFGNLIHTVFQSDLDASAENVESFLTEVCNRLPAATPTQVAKAYSSFRGSK